MQALGLILGFDFRSDSKPQRGDVSPGAGRGLLCLRPLNFTPLHSRLPGANQVCAAHTRVGSAITISWLPQQAVQQQADVISHTDTQL